MISAASERSPLLESRPREVVFDDVATLNFKRLGHVWTECTCFWLASLTWSLSNMVFVRSRSVVTAEWLSRWIFMLGTVWGLVRSLMLLWDLLNNTRMMFESDRHRMLSLGIHATHTQVDFSSFPIMRLLLCLLVVSVVTLCSILLSELFCFAWCRRGVVGVLEALVPVVILFSVSLLFFSCLRSVSTCHLLLFALIAVETVFVALKISDSNAMSWTAIFVPYWLILLVCCCDIMYIVYLSFAHYRNKTPSLVKACQLLCIVFAVVIGFGSTFRIAAMELRGRGGGSANNPTPEFDLYCDSGHLWLRWLCSIWILFASGLITGNRDCIDYANRRGYRDPLSVSRTKDGWEPVPPVDVQHPSILLV